MRNIIKGSILERLLFLMVGLLISQWVIAIRELPVLTNLFILFVIIVSIKTGIRSIMKENIFEIVEVIKEEEM